MTPEFWTARLPDADRLLADPASIAAQNERRRALDPAVRSLESLPDTVVGDQVRAWTSAVSRRPHSRSTTGMESDRAGGNSMSRRMRWTWTRSPGPSRHALGLVTHRASLRTFPTARQVFNQRGDTDLDRFQETAFFPGTPVAVVDRDRSGDWAFVVGEFYVALMAAEAVEIGERGAVLGYGRREPSLIVTAPQVRTMPFPGQPTLSELALDMGVRVPRCRTVRPTLR